MFMPFENESHRKYFFGRGALRYAQIMMKTGRFQKNNMTVPVIFEEHVKKHPNKICYISEERKWTFKQVHSKTY